MWKTISNHIVYQLLRYLVVNGVFAACLYYGFIVPESVEGAKNVALFMGWGTAFVGVLLYIALAIDDTENNPKKGELREKLAREMPQSRVPFPIDMLFDVCVTCVFIWYGHYVLAAFYALSIYAGKELRDIPKNLMLNKLKSQGFEA